MYILELINNFNARYLTIYVTVFIVAQGIKYNKILLLPSFLTGCQYFNKYCPTSVIATFRLKKGIPSLYNRNS